MRFAINQSSFLSSNGVLSMCKVRIRTEEVAVEKFRGFYVRASWKYCNVRVWYKYNVLVHVTSREALDYEKNLAKSTCKLTQCE